MAPIRIATLGSRDVYSFEDGLKPWGLEQYGHLVPWAISLPSAAPVKEKFPKIEVSISGIVTVAQGVDALSNFGPS